jgi:tetratricopeptide (TPR) repeat protein
MGAVYMAAGRYEDAIPELEQAIQLNRRFPEAHNNLGVTLFKLKRLDQAITQYQLALSLRPEYALAHRNLGEALGASGKPAEAIAHLRRALELQPTSPEAHESLAEALQGTGKPREAIEHFTRALELKPDYPVACNNLAWLYVTCTEMQLRNPAEALRLAKRAVELTSEKDPSMLDTLAAAYAETGKLTEAITTAEKALALAKAAKNDALTNEIETRLKRYRDQPQNRR